MIIELEGRDPVGRLQKRMCSSGKTYNKRSGMQKWNIFKAAFRISMRIDSSMFVGTKTYIR